MTNILRIACDTFDEVEDIANKLQNNDITFIEIHRAKRFSLFKPYYSVKIYLKPRELPYHDQLKAILHEDKTTVDQKIDKIGDLLVSIIGEHFPRPEQVNL